MGRMRSVVQVGSIVGLAWAAGIVPGASATHESDQVYDQPVWFEWDTKTLDVLVVPPKDGNALGWTRAVEGALASWKDGIAAFAPTWLRAGVRLNVYVAGQGAPPAAALQDLEVIVTPAPTYHALHMGRQCVAHAGGLGGFDETWRVAAHEFGHCLGLGHTGDGANAATYHPFEDVMSYGPDSDLECVSNLNVQTLGLVFGAHFGRAHGGAASVPVADYAQIDCN